MRLKNSTSVNTSVNQIGIEVNSVYFVLYIYLKGVSGLKDNNR